MTSSIGSLLEKLCSENPDERASAAAEIFRLGRISSDRVIEVWVRDAGFSSLLGARPQVTVGVAVEPQTFETIRKSNGMPRLAEVPPDQDAQEFELRFPENVSLDILTTNAPGGRGAIARFLEKFGEGIQQVEYACKDVDRATRILQEKFNLVPVYPATRAGADGTRVNFFFVTSPDGKKVLIELYVPAKQSR
jgi:hypothetical protein